MILFKLLFAHFLADFTLQPDTICRGKRAEGCKGGLYVLLHSLIHAFTAYVLVAEWTNWMLPLVIGSTHFGMDWVKAKYLRNCLATFLVDQAVHLAVLVCLWYFLFTDAASAARLSELALSPRCWLIATAYLLVLQPSSLVLGWFIGKWAPAEMKEKSLPNAGKWIGYLERVLILTFILVGAMEGVGFLLAAKSIFRFGELNKAQEIRTTEYVLIGTLASFTIAVLVGLVVEQWG